MKTKILLLSIIFIFGLSITALAQESDHVLVDQDENITAQDLEISEPRILPNSPFYFLKNWIRGIQNVLTLDPIKKAELKLKFVNEKIIETKVLAEKTKKPEILKKALNNYNQELKQVEDAVQKIKEEQPEKIDKFLNKFIDNQIKHQKLIGKFGKEMPQEVAESVQEIKIESAEQLSTIPLLFEEPDVFQERIEKIFEKQPGSRFKHFKNLEVLKEVEQRVPEQAKPAIQRAYANILKRLESEIKNKIETSLGKASGKAAPTTPSKEVSKEFIKYIQEIGGNKKYQQEIITQLEQRGQIEIPVDVTKIPESTPGVSGESATPKDVPNGVMPVPEEVKCVTNATCVMGYIPYNTGGKDAQNCPIIECKCKECCEDGTPFGQCSVEKPFRCYEEHGLIKECLECGCPTGLDCLNNTECITTKPIPCQTNFKMADIYLFMKDDPDAQINLERLTRAKNTYEQVINIAGRGKITFDLSYPIIPIEINEANKDKLLFVNLDGKLYLQLSEITKEFYKSNPDNFDFINIFHNFFMEDEPSHTSNAHATVIANIKNIGKNLRDLSNTYGSKRLLGVTTSISAKITYSPENLAEFSEEQIACMTAVGGVVHETTHQWSAFIGDTYSSGGNLILQNSSGGHWFQGLNLNYDPVGGGKWRDNSDGTFTLVEHDEYCAPQDPNAPGRYGIDKMSDLTLYLASAIDANQVKPILWIDYNGALDIGTTIQAESKYITIEDIIARHGERACLDFSK